MCIPSLTFLGRTHRMVIESKILQRANRAACKKQIYLYIGDTSKNDQNRF